LNIPHTFSVSLFELRVDEKQTHQFGRCATMAGSNLFTGTLDLLILQSLIEGPMHGYGIGRQLSDRTRGILELEEGVLYPALYRLNRKGLIKSEWGETETGRRARYYSLTRKGKTSHKREKARWEEHIRAVQTVLNPDQV
jgi:transcriptional regulator